MHFNWADNDCLKEKQFCLTDIAFSSTFRRVESSSSGTENPFHVVLDFSLGFGTIVPSYPLRVITE